MKHRPYIQKMVDYKEKLIIAVQDFPALYDHTRKDYKNLQRKNLCWEQVAEKMEMSGKHYDLFL